MKNGLLLLVLCTLFTFGMSAQEAETNSGPEGRHIVKFSPLALVKVKGKLHYEYAGLGIEKLSVGTQASYFFGIYPGFRVAPFGRYYITGGTGEGFFVQAKGHFSMNSIEFTYTDGNNVQQTSSNSFSEYGAGAGLGYQFLFGSNDNFTLDLWTGYRYSSFSGLSAVSSDNASTLGFDDAFDVTKVAYRVLHSNMFDMGFSLGWAF